jgi:hypothetical protein
MDFKKSQFILEESKNSLNESISKLSDENEQLS